MAAYIAKENFKEGQVVKHESGFIAVITEHEGVYDSDSVGVILTVIEQGKSNQTPGYKYDGLSEFIEEILADSLEEYENGGKEKEPTTFKARIDTVEFEGNKADFKVFMEELTKLYSTVGGLK
jgi:hypothetical protein